MAAPNLTSSDYLNAFQALMPRGLVWPRDQDAVQTQVVAGITKVYARGTARANYLLVDAFPATTNELLPEWEATLGLPDPCAGAAPTVQVRRAQVVARLTNTGSQSAPYFTQIAANLGYDITVQNFRPARANVSRCGDACNQVAWASAWAIEAPLNTVSYAQSSLAVAGDALASWGNEVLECEINALKPAHTVVLFQYAAEIFDNTVVDDFGHPVLMGTGMPIIT
ncbi:DUF2313 domain-containing protein [Paraburkholderia sp. FT54]|uniref:YmfQ family protein n=1 Tax=Paraburkholderia sp. FT54 TaxID=3074437 RepID=UPI00287761D4|nr:putative phage tail protein [Paraburkholderia sp. FT54]WNC90966.1 DUF2313 domain-containing protein [Paraburkholderia sp. FT54]